MQHIYSFQTDYIHMLYGVYIFKDYIDQNVIKYSSEMISIRFITKHCSSHFKEKHARANLTIIRITDDGL